MIKHSLGTILRAKAKALGLSGAEVARRVGIPERRYSYYVGDKSEPNLETLLKICRVLAATPSELCGYDDSADISIPPINKYLLERVIIALEKKIASKALILTAENKAKAIIYMYQLAVLEGKTNDDMLDTTLTILQDN